MVTMVSWSQESPQLSCDAGHAEAAGLHAVVGHGLHYQTPNESFRSQAREETTAGRPSVRPNLSNIYTNSEVNVK